MTEMVDFHVTDLSTLNALFQAAAASSLSFGFRGSILPRITKLSVTLSLPLAFFRALETTLFDDNGSPLSSFEKDISLWFAMPSGLASFAQLRRFHIWLDHPDKEFWSAVNEHEILSHFEALQTGTPSLNMVATLPKLHPQKQDPQRHYLGDNIAPFEIRRVLRQRYRVVNYGTAGASMVIYVQDFPHGLGHPDFDDMSLAELEQHEAKLWRLGVDVVQYLSFTGSRGVN